MNDIVVTTMGIATTDAAIDVTIENRVGFASMSSSSTTARVFDIATEEPAGIGIVHRATASTLPVTLVMRYGVIGMVGSGISVRARHIWLTLWPMV